MKYKRSCRPHNLKSKAIVDLLYNTDSHCQAGLAERPVWVELTRRDDEEFREERLIWWWDTHLRCHPSYDLSLRGFNNRVAVLNKCARNLQCHKLLNTQEGTASARLMWERSCQEVEEKKKENEPGHLRLDCVTIWEGDWNGGKARYRFHKVSCVRPLEQAKSNITSIALIKAQPRWWKNNDVRATALLRTDWKKVGASNHSTPLAVPWPSPVSISPHP